MVLLQKCKQYIKTHYQSFIPPVHLIVLNLPIWKSDRFSYCKNQLFPLMLPIISFFTNYNKIKNSDPAFVLEEKTVQAADGISIFSFSDVSVWMCTV